MGGQGTDVEIEHRFWIPDHTILPGLGKGSKIVQCYLRRDELYLVDGAVYFKDQMLVRKWKKGDVEGVSVTAEQAKKINQLLDPEDYRVDSFRIRIFQDRKDKFHRKANVTVKGPGYPDRFEAEWEIVLTPDIDQMVNSGGKPKIQKIRYEVIYDGETWEIDKFLEDNNKLWLAEIEIPSNDYSFKVPSWVGKKLDGDNGKRLGNGTLAKGDKWEDLQLDEEFMRWLKGPN